MTEIFQTLLSEHRSIDIAESEFQKLIYEQPEIREAYREWCREEGHTEKRGFTEYCMEYLEEEEDKWQSLQEDEYE